MVKKILIGLMLVVGLWIGTGRVMAQETATISGQIITMHLFHGETCPHCQAEIKWLEEEYLPNNPDIAVKKYEVWGERENGDALSELSEKMNFTVSGVPVMIIGEKVVSGYGSGMTNKEIEQILNDYRQNGEYRDVAGELLAGMEVEMDIEEEIVEEKVFNLPVLGEVNSKTVSLPILAMMIGLVDGFNPCSMWILIFLITMLFNMKDRKRMWILGLTFLITSALVYLFFMVSWLNLAVFLNKITFLQTMIAGVAIVFGVMNLNNYYKARNKEEACEVVDAKKRKKIIERIKDITNEQKFWLAMVGIIILAASVNLIELMCSLGLPVVFTQILSLNNLEMWQYALYMLLYIVFFLIDDIVVFTIAMKTLKIATASSKYVKYSHLIGGLIMAVIGVLMLFKPEFLMFNF